MTSDALHCKVEAASVIAGRRIASEVPGVWRGGPTPRKLGEAQRWGATYMAPPMIPETRCPPCQALQGVRRFLRRVPSFRFGARPVEVRSTTPAFAVNPGMARNVLQTEIAAADARRARLETHV